MRIHPLFNTDEPGGGAATFEINGQQMTAEQIVESYKKLQSDHTKVTQKNSEMSKDQEKAKPWLEFEKTLDEISTKTGVNVKALAGAQLDGLITSIVSGKTPTSGQLDKLDDAKDKATSEGDKASLKKLEALESVVMEQEYEKAIDSIEKTAKSDGIDFDRAEFIEFADKWLDELGIGEEDEFDLKLFNKAYQAYEAKIIKEAKKGGIPPLQTSGGAGGAGRNSTAPQKVGGLKGANQKVMEFLVK
jgi:hypothetical protein